MAHSMMGKENGLQGSENKGRHCGYMSLPVTEGPQDPGQEQLLLRVLVLSGKDVKSKAGSQKSSLVLRISERSPRV